LAADGVRIVVDDLRTDVTKTRKDGTAGRPPIGHGAARDPPAAIAGCGSSSYAEPRVMPNRRSPAASWPLNGVAMLIASA
jgi:hypothetical protein